jgi:hypothetical protein
VEEDADMTKRKAVWPKGLPRAGFKASGMNLKEWIEFQKSQPVRKVCAKEVDKSTASCFRYECYEDSVRRTFIRILSGPRTVVAHEQIKPVRGYQSRYDPFGQAVQMTQALLGER